MSWLSSRLPFPALLALRSQLDPAQRALTLLTVVAIGVSVAMATGLEMASRSVEAELQRTAEMLAGSAELEITGGSLGVPEALVDVAARIPGVRVAAPFLETTVRLRDGTGEGTAIHLLGVDLLADPDVRMYRFNSDGVKKRDAFRLVAGANSVVITEGLSRRLSLDLGSELRLVADGRPLELSVQAILREGGVADAFGGQVALMDVYVMQTLLGREGMLDRIDIVLDGNANLAGVTAVLMRGVGERGTIRRAAMRDSWVDTTMAAISLVIWILVVVGVLIASLVAYSTLSLSVDRRSREFSLLRCAGLEARRIRLLVLMDSLLLSAAASPLGIGAGILLSRSFVSVFSKLSSYLQGVEVQHLTVTPLTIAMGLGVGLVAGTLGALEPAYRASMRAPLDAAETSATMARGASARSLWVYAMIGVAWLALSLGPLKVGATVRLPLIFVGGLLLVALLSRDVFPIVVLRVRPVLERFVSRVGRLSGAAPLARPFHTAITVSTIAGVVAGVTITLVIVHSLSITLDDWTASQYPDGIFVAAGNPLGGQDREDITREVLSIIGGTPGVSAVFDHFTANVIYQGEEILVGASTMGVMAKRGRLPAIDGDPQEIALALLNGDAAISDQFARHFHVSRGAKITLATPQGARDFVVAGIIRDYAGPSGSINLDIGIFDELWPRAGSSNLVIWVDGSIEPVLEEIRRRVGDRQPLFFVYGEELERYASSIIGQFTALLDMVSYITGVLGGIAVLNLLLGSVVERRREFALLRSTGATRFQLIALVLIEGVMISLAGAAAGVLLGIACSYPMVTEVIRDAMSWWIQFSLPFGSIVLLSCFVIAAAGVASLYPAWQTQRQHAREALAPE